MIDYTNTVFSFINIYIYTYKYLIFFSKKKAEIYD